jgi:hypothetical protein
MTFTYHLIPQLPHGLPTTSTNEHPLNPASNPNQASCSQQTWPRISRRTKTLQSRTCSPHYGLPRNRYTRSSLGSQYRKPQQDLQTRHANTKDNQDNDDPGNARHLFVANGIREDLAEVEKDLASLVEDLDAGFDLEVFTYGGVEGMKGGFRVPEEIWRVEHVRC